MEIIKNLKTRRKNEIRYHSVEVKTRNGEAISINHPAYIFMEQGDIYIYVTITHSNKVNDCLVVKLTKNPNPNDKTMSFWVAEIRKDNKKNFGKRHNNWAISEEDRKVILEFYNQYLNEKR